MTGAQGAMEQIFKRHFDSLDAVFAFVERFVGVEKVGRAVAFAINLAVEEIFTNMVKYNTGAGNDIAVRINKDAGTIVMSLVDNDVDPFDPASAPDAGIDKTMDERTPGGLGLHLVKSVVDKVSYEYENRQMTVTVIKNLE
jgi:anti-sigma regulatory factor (Ser/Thr protein kinase)